MFQERTLWLLDKQQVSSFQGGYCTGSWGGCSHSTLQTPLNPCGGTSNACAVWLHSCYEYSVAMSIPKNSIKSLLVAAPCLSENTAQAALMAASHPLCLGSVQSMVWFAWVCDFPLNPPSQIFNFENSSNFALCLQLSDSYIMCLQPLYCGKS